MDKRSNKILDIKCENVTQNHSGLSLDYYMQGLTVADHLERKEIGTLSGIERFMKINFRKQDSFSQVQN